MRLLVHMPTRGRLERAVHCLELYQKLASGKHDITYRCVIDEDDQVMQAQGFRDELAKYCDLYIGDHSTKIEACNAGIPADGWDVLLLASDDMTPVQRDWDDFVARAMEGCFPNLDGGLHFNDGRVEKKLCTYPIIGRNMYLKFGYVYQPDYKGFCCDVEYTKLFQALRRLPYFDTVLFRHDHYIYQKKWYDETYKENDPYYAEDKRTLRRRKSMRLEDSPYMFGFPPVRLSILICSLEEREEQLKELLDCLNYEINSYDIAQEVEICINIDDGCMLVGDKRNALIRQSVGDYIAFIDDDDMVSPSYCRKIIRILRKESPACIGMVGEITTDGRNPKKFYHSLKYDKWFHDEDGYYRPPNHLNPVRYDIVKETDGFPAKDHGEDRDYSERLLDTGMMTSEVMIDKVMYYYRYSKRGSRAQKKKRVRK